jgi:hypothetical protein
MSHPIPDKELPRRIEPAALAAFLVACLAFLPIANWIPGGHAAPWYASERSTWISGTAIALGIGIVLAIFSGKIAWLWRDNATENAAAAFERRPFAASLCIAVLALLLYAVIARVVLGARPLLIDEIVQMVQANMLAHGHLWLPVDSHPEFFSSMHIVDTNGRYFSQFPVGGPAMLTLGVWLHAPWLVGPVFGAITVLAFAAYLRVAEPRPGVALGATLVLAFAPFTAFMAGSHMNHVTMLTWIVIGMAAMAKVMTSDTPRPSLALLSGLAFGIAGTIRPVDALAFALPAGVWYLVRALRSPAKWKDAIPAAVGVAIPLALLLWVNARTTGSPLLFGYEQLWGKSHALGFHAAPWGIAHTPARGLELVNLYFLWLQSYFLETPVPSLLAAIIALALVRRLDRFDRYLLVSSALLVGLYFAYWHKGLYLGPRFMYALLPALALWTARFPGAVRDRFGQGAVYRSAVYATLCALAIAVIALVPLRARQYRQGMLTMRWDADSAAAASGVKHALVFVRESWGAELVARLWALGATRPETELLYNTVDACALEQAITHLEQQNVRGAAAFSALRPLLADSARTVASTFSPDTTERALPGMSYPPVCTARIEEDQAGFTLFPPLLLARGGDNVYARDLGARDTLLLRRYPDRAVYLLKPPDSDVGSMPVFQMVRHEAMR